ncbi:MAG: ABC transporter ATP-binding protein [Candidatus Thorarchaeota archaeon]|nr:ABC transporter ATP-binding protein [Candidatus Thorarchaeota archaeon]
MSDSEYSVELIGIDKTFPSGVQANKSITIRIRRGEVHGLLGENGAGKSTLMNILYGLLRRDAGKILIDGQEVSPSSPVDAIAHGVGMVHQHFKLIPRLSVTENVILGLEPVLALGICAGLKKAGPLSMLFSLDYAAASKRIKQIAEENGLVINPDSLVQDLSVGLQQRVEIIKTLYREAKILILDEPTSVLTPQEVDELFVTLRKFKEQGKTIILITHKLREVMAICDRISVLRDGALVGTVQTADTSPQQLALMMVGREVVFTLEKTPARPGEVVLDVDRLCVRDNRGLEVVKSVSLQVRAGEILGVAGVEGNGQTELVEALAGLRSPASGRISISGVESTKMGPRQVRDIRVAHIPEDRHRRGLILGFTVQENLVLGKHHRPPYARGPLGLIIDEQCIRASSETLVSSYAIKVPDTLAAAKTMSGGNQQKTVVARELSGDPALVLAAQPTRGLDVGATEYIHGVLLGMRDRGAAVLLVSAELDEVRNLADRIAVMYGGRIVAMCSPDTTQEQLGLLMAGHVTEEASVA